MTTPVMSAAIQNEKSIFSAPVGEKEEIHKEETHNSVDKGDVVCCNHVFKEEEG